MNMFEQKISRSKIDKLPVKTSKIHKHFRKWQVDYTLCHDLTFAVKYAYMDSSHINSYIVNLPLYNSIVYFFHG